MKAIDLTGKRFGKLLVSGRAPSKGKVTRWLARCDCGVEPIVRTNNLTSGHTRSCGCVYRYGVQRHGHAKHGNESPEYRSWSAMIRRCTDPKDKSFEYYAGRGIGVCQQWLRDFPAFVSHIGPRSPGTTLDRIDNNRGYEPGNVRWATPKEQANNRRPRRSAV